MKPKPSAVRQFNQAPIPSSFLSKSRETNEDLKPKPSKRSISLSDFLNRRIGSTSCRSVQEKRNSFSSIGSIEKELRTKKREEKGDGFMLDGSVFRRFDPSVKEQLNGIIDGDHPDSRKRKIPVEASSPSGFTFDDHRKTGGPKCLVVLGDDPKLRPTKRGKHRLDGSSKSLYNHYENGCGLWDECREGVDNEEVGCNQPWEGMGSTTLGGLEWH